MLTAPETTSLSSVIKAVYGSRHPPTLTLPSRILLLGSHILSLSIALRIIFLHSEGRDKDDLHVQVDGVGLVVVSVDMRSFLESVYA